MTVLIKIGLVAAGGALGAVVRFWLGGLIASRTTSRFPIGTFLINVSGSMLLGLMLGSGLRDTYWWYLGGIGFMGAYTTFSTFKYESMLLMERKDMVALALYIGGSYTAGILLAWFGLWLGQQL